MEKYFGVLENRDEFIELQYIGHSYLVKPQLFKKVPTPKFNFGVTVRLRKTGGYWNYFRNQLA